MRSKSVARRLMLFAVFFCGSVSAAPILRLANSQVNLAQTSAGAAAAGRATVEAFNVGDGSLSLTVSVPAAIPWLTASVGAVHACTLPWLANSCIPLEFTVNTGNLALGIHMAPVTVSDPNAIDGPQVVTVVVWVDGQAPLAPIDAQMAPGTSATIPYFRMFLDGFPVITTSNGSKWLSVAYQKVTYTWPPWSFWEVTGIVLAPGVGMPPGTYTGSITDDRGIFPVTLTVAPPAIAPQGPPLVYYQGVVDNVSFTMGPVAQGDVAVVFGDKLSLSDPVSAPSAPLPTRLGGARVLINGTPAPLYYSSDRQVTFQVPFGTGIGLALVQLERDGQASNTVTVSVAARAPEIAAVTDTSYNLVDLSHPTHASRLILWAIGLGATSPPAPDGAPAPANLPAVVTLTPTVLVVGSAIVSHDLMPDFAGLSPGAVGLYQVIVTVPADVLSSGDYIDLALHYGSSYSNGVRVGLR